MARSATTLDQYMYEIRHEVDQAKKSAEFPNKLLFEWIHKDICESILRLGGVINQLYRTNATIAISGAAGHYDATVLHASASTDVTGLSISADVWAGGSIIVVDSNLIYVAQIVSNTTTQLVITNGSDLPVMDAGGEPAMLTANDSNYSIPLSSLLMINYPEPIWQVLDASGASPVPLEPIDIEEARNIAVDPMNDNEAYWYLLGQTVQIAAGASKSLSGNMTIGYYKLPVEATALTDLIDFPIEYHDIAQQRTMIRVLKKLGMADRARAREVDLERRWALIEKNIVSAPQLDQSTGERSLN